jgi:membrane protease YdiL (CAAX protease family)
MPLSPLQLALSVGIELAIFGGCAAVWSWVGVQASQGRPAIPLRPRRPVPWDGWDVMMILALYFSAATAALWILSPRPPRGEAKPVQQAAGPEEKNEHPVVQLWRQDPRWATKLLSAVAAVIVAPVVEEFLFRLLLQGWLEKADRRLRRRLRLLLPGALPIATVAALFAAMHYRSGPPAHDAATIIRALLGNAAAGLVTVALGAAWLRSRSGAAWDDFGIEPRRIGRACGLGLAAFLAVAPPIYLLQMWLVKWVSPGTADPITLFFFALVLGVLYYRTHRIVPAIALHMALNGTSLLFLLLGTPA